MKKCFPSFGLNSTVDSFFIAFSESDLKANNCVSHKQEFWSFGLHKKWMCIPFVWSLY